MKRLVLILCITVVLPVVSAAQVGGSFSYDTIGKKKTTPVLELKEMDDTPAAQPVQNRSNAGQPAERRQRTSAGRWGFGGSLGFSVSSGEWGLHVSPQVTYRLSSVVQLGLGVTYSYYEGRDYGDYELNYFGVGALLRVYPVRNLFVFARPEVHRRWGTVYRYETKSETFACLPLGLGYSVPLGPRSAMNVSFFYDVIQNRYSPYGDRVSYSVGYSFGW